MHSASDCGEIILADGHVHIHPCFDLALCLDAALANFLSVNPQGYFLLLLTESPSEQYFEDFYQAACQKSQENLSLGNWTIQTTQENCSLCAVHCHSRHKVFILSGQQIATSEKLEVLALMTTEKFAEGQPLEAVVKTISDKGGIPVIPWGFGKWMGRRGQILSRYLAQKDLPPLFLGDNSGRPWFWPDPLLFKIGRAQGLKVLPGTDPFPFPSEFQRPGCFGFSLEGFGYFDAQRPASSLKQALLNPSVQPRTYGSLEKPFRFIRNQLMMQLLKYQRNR